MANVEDERSFNEAMNDWAARQSFFRNMGNRIVHPDPELPWPFRLFGYLFRLAVVLFFIGGISFVMMKKYLSSQGFSDKVGASLASHLKADDYSSTSFLWKDSRVSVKKFSANGGDDAFFRTLEARFVRFRSAPLALLFSDWKLKDITIAELDVMMRSGAKIEMTGSHREGSTDPTLMYAGIGPPDFGRVRFESLTVDDASFRWGLSNATRGSLSNAAASFDAGETSDGWRLDFTNAVFEQNWLKKLSIPSLSVRREDGKLMVDEVNVTLPSGGTGTLGGSVTLGDLPQVSLTLNLTHASLEDFVPPAFQRYVTGDITGKVVFSGSINTKAGIETTADLDVRGILRNIPVFESLSLLTQTSRLRHFPITKGKVSFKTSGGILKVTNLEIAAEDIAVLTGRFSFEPTSVDEPDADILSSLPSEEVGPVIPEIETEAGSDGPGLPDYICKGSLSLGVVPDRLTALEEAADAHFREEGGGFRWMKISLNGQIDELTKTLYDTMILNVSENRRKNADR